MSSATLAYPSVDEKQEPETGKLGMWVFLASELLFFGGLFVAYLYGRLHFPAGWAEGSRHTDVLLGTVNTAVLLTSSAAVALALACEEDGHARRWTARLLSLTAALGIAFLLLKGLEWHDEWREHLLPGPDFALHVAGAQQFFALYFLMTGLHAVHMICGIGALGLLARGRSRGRAWAGARALEVAALYWHFVDVVWIFLYPLLYLVDRHG
ncbi:MAG: cytochrome c oxidase subunit 3 [Burkholderiales bacterium]|nr:cytochrome c oxidase subunit 3 [Burkholderiales bacterium]